jgi:hypothetical protein
MGTEPAKDSQVDANTAQFSRVGHIDRRTEPSKREAENRYAYVADPDGYEIEIWFE